MTHRQKMLIGLCGSLALCTGATAVTPAGAGNPYQAIVDRNVFALKAPPPPAKPEDNKPPPPKITLTGITTIFGKARALMTAQIPAKPGEPAKMQSFMLAEGQRDGDIEVIQIEDKAGKVKVNDFGTIVDLDIEKDSPKIATGPVPGAPPPGGLIPPAPVPGGLNPVAPGGGAASPFGGGLKTIPTRSLRLPTTTTSSSGVPVGSMPALGFGGAPTVSQPSAQGSSLSHEQQMIMMEVEREQNKNNPNYPPPPPTPLTQAATGSGTTSSSGGRGGSSTTGPVAPPMPPGGPMSPPRFPQ